jgi:hypothetical protein
VKTALLVAALIVVAVLLNCAAAAIPSEHRAQRAVENIGMHNVRVTKQQPAWGVLGGCHEQDVAKFTVVGTSADGQQHTVQVCAPLIGGYTIRN